MAKLPPPFLRESNDPWVSDLILTMPLRHKIGQLFQVAAFSTGDKAHEENILKLIQDYHIGGLTFFQGTAGHQLNLINKYQECSEVPLFMNIDAEWGLAMRLSDAVQFPYQMTLGAIRDINLIKTMATQIALHCKSLGLQSPLAPVVDINNNPKNPVIGFRSFGDDKDSVATRALKYMEGLQENNILAVAKHFPGHGDTDVDSHLQLPVLRHNPERIDEVELYPFKYLIDHGLGAVMTAHLHIPGLDSTPHLPATLSKKIITGLLRQKLGFEGLVITDAMDMKGISSFYSSAEADKMALIAGNDIITNSRNIPEGIKRIEKAIADGELHEDWLNEKVRRILAMKKWTGLHNWKAVSKRPFVNKEMNRLNNELSDQALTVIKSDNNIVIDTNKRNASLRIICENKTVNDKSVEHHLKLIENSGGADHFYQLLQKENLMDAYYVWQEKDGIQALKEIVDDLKKYDNILLTYHNVNVKPQNHFDIPTNISGEISRLFKDTAVILCFFGNAYALNEVKNHTQSKVLVLTYQESRSMHHSVIKYLKGDLISSGKLPVCMS